MINTKKQTGLTLIEMMIAMVLGLFVTAVIITVFSTNVRSSTENIKMIRLNQELRGVMTMMVDELKRHGYSSESTNADFMNDFNINSTCVRYSYDEINRDPSGSEVDGEQDTDERFGFKLENNTIMWTRSGGDVGATKGAPDCDNGVWESLTIVDIASITALQFDTAGSVNKDGSTVNPGSFAWTTTTGISLYDITITLTGATDLPHSSTANDPRRTIIETVRVRNDDPKD
ncbi:MAG: PilW family protein [Cycloclasticus pugetii]|uniref:PilW family protein n=1 Tax=Cycloclasticus pugetii TaxID=34068 RepID=UPI003A94ECA3